MTQSKTTESPTLSLIIPTYNEAENIQPLIERLTPLLTEALTDTGWELIFVDDNSPDHTAQVIHQIAKKDRRIRCLRRRNKRGLASACIDGFLASHSPYLAVMDADLQHDEYLLPKMLQAMQEDSLDMAVASRFTAMGSTGALNSKRSHLSQLANAMSRLCNTPDKLSDPMSGYFVFRRSRFEASFNQLYGEGFKILLDLLSSLPAQQGASLEPQEKIRIREFPYHMNARHSGTSKMEAHVALSYGLMLLNKLAKGKIPHAFLMFTMVGLSGLVIHLSTLLMLKHIGFEHFTAAQSLATLTAMTSNFFLNNRITYREQRLHGKALLAGLLSFYCICSIGALINISFANFIDKMTGYWLLAGTVGAVVGAIWNYSMSANFTWTKSQ